MHEQLLFVFWQSSHTRTWLPFTAVSMFIAHATLVHGSTSMYQWPYPFRKKRSPISALPCCTVSIIISARVIGLRSLESDVLYNSWPAKQSKIFSISGICYMNKKERKISGVAWSLLDTEEHRLIIATRRKLSRLSLRLIGDLFFYEHILGPMI